MTSSSESRSSQPLGNRRAHPRATLAAPVLVDSARTHHTGRCRDVSEGGLSIELEGELAVGAPVELYFELPTGIAIEAQAAVVRRSGQAFAFRFQELPREGRRAIVAYCDAWRAALLSEAAQRAASFPNVRRGSFRAFQGGSIPPDAPRAPRTRSSTD